MDFDKFEFKPLTDGLGFDKKADKQKAKTSNPTVDISSFEIESPKKKEPNLFEKPVDWSGTASSRASKSIADMLESLPPSLDFLNEPATDSKKKREEPKIYNPIGREDYPVAQLQKEELFEPQLKEIKKPATEVKPPVEEKVDVSLNNTLEKAFPQEGFRRPFFQQSVEIKPQYTPVSASITSGILDFLVITGVMTLFLVSLVLFTGVDLLAVVLNSQATRSVWIELGAIYFGVYILYYLAARGIWGSSLGDWAFDIQLGLEDERKRWYYPFQIITRMTGVALTGFIILPLLSLIFKSDLAYGFSGLRLHMKNY